MLSIHLNNNSIIHHNKMIKIMLKSNLMENQRHHSWIKRRAIGPKDYRLSWSSSSIDVPSSNNRTQVLAWRISCIKLGKIGINWPRNRNRLTEMNQHSWQLKTQLLQCRQLWRAIDLRRTCRARLSNTTVRFKLMSRNLSHHTCASYASKST